MRVRNRLSKQYLDDVKTAKITIYLNIDVFLYTHFRLNRIHFLVCVRVCVLRATVCVTGSNEKYLIQNMYDVLINTHKHHRQIDSNKYNRGGRTFFSLVYFRKEFFFLGNSKTM